MLTPGFVSVRCQACGETYEIVKNPWNSTLPACTVRVGQKKCGGRLEKWSAPSFLSRPQAGTVTSVNELDELLAPDGGLDKYLR